VGTLNVDEAIEYCRLKHESKPQESCPKNYDTCYLFIDKCREYACPLICFAKPLKSFAKPRISFAKQKLQMKQTTSNAANGMCIKSFLYKYVVIFFLFGQGLK